MKPNLEVPGGARASHGTSDGARIGAEAMRFARGGCARWLFSGCGWLIAVMAWLAWLAWLA